MSGISQLSSHVSNATATATEGLTKKQAAKAKLQFGQLLQMQLEAQERGIEMKRYALERPDRNALPGTSGPQKSLKAKPSDGSGLPLRKSDLPVRTKKKKPSKMKKIILAERKKRAGVSEPEVPAGAEAGSAAAPTDVDGGNAATTAAASEAVAVAGTEKVDNALLDIMRRFKCTLEEAKQKQAEDEDDDSDDDDSDDDDDDSDDDDESDEDEDDEDSNEEGGKNPKATQAKRAPIVLPKAVLPPTEEELEEMRKEEVRQKRRAARQAAADEKALAEEMKQKQLAELAEKKRAVWHGMAWHEIASIFPCYRHSRWCSNLSACVSGDRSQGKGARLAIRGETAGCVG
jgi:hypothetical protein